MSRAYSPKIKSPRFPRPTLALLALPRLVYHAPLALGIYDADKQQPDTSILTQNNYEMRMPQSLAHILIHVVFSTKDRTPFITMDVREKIHAYLAGIVREQQGECYRVGGVADHVHLAIRLPRTQTMAAIIEQLKTSSSKWIKTLSPELAHFS
jgi:Transposase IS200 like